mgnify:CR=1 FL=1
MLDHVKLLKNKNAPRVFTPQQLHDFFKANGAEVTPRTVSTYLGNWCDIGLVEKVAFGVFLNRTCDIQPIADEASGFIRNKAVVSLQRVLGAAGVLNNPSHWITCVIPYGAGVRDGLVSNNSTTFKFTKIHETLFPGVQDDWFVDALDTNASYLRATPEKAILDWVYLGTIPTGRAKPLPPRHDIDFDLFDMDRLARLAQKMNLEEQYQKWSTGKLKSSIKF